MSATPPLRLASAEGRWTIAATVLGSAAVFLESTVVSVALPAIGRDLSLGVAGLQWIVNGYLITLSALLLLGGALGDAWGQKRAFGVGLLVFAAGSVVTALAPTFPLLIAARVVQGAAGALLVPTSLAYLDTAFAAEDRNEAIGVWAAWSAVSTAVGPVLGGVIIDNVSWRWVFASVVPLALAASWIARSRAPDRPRPAPRRVDAVGAVLISAGLGAVVWALIEGSSRGPTADIVIVGTLGLVLGLAFFWFEARSPTPLLPMGMFRSRQFAGANATTLLVYAALGALFFFLMVQLQAVMGYSGLAAGASLLPINVLMLALSPPAGRWAERAGPRVPLAIGAALAGAGLALMSRVGPGSDYGTDLLPAVVVFGSGLGLLVAPLTSAVLAAAESGRTGVASGVNNAIARLAGLLATTLLPLIVGIGGLEDVASPVFVAGFRRAMWIAAGLCVAASGVAWLTVREGAAVAPAPHPSPTQACARHRA